MPIEPMTIYVAIGVPVIILCFAAMFWFIRKYNLAKKTLVVSIATMVISGTFLFLDLVIGLGQMVAFYIGIVIAVAVGIMLRRVLNVLE
ncbi:MAG TPA: hypothetical protein VNK96_00100 [Fimbriimonadales bacterium]|nr:hypothetical protein [Fimbriimonadales bacterium]